MSSAHDKSAKIEIQKALPQEGATETQLGSSHNRLFERPVDFRLDVYSQHLESAVSRVAGFYSTILNSRNDLTRELIISFLNDLCRPLDVLDTANWDSKPISLIANAPSANTLRQITTICGEVRHDYCAHSLAEILLRSTMRYLHAQASGKPSRKKIAEAFRGIVPTLPPGGVCYEFRFALEHELSAARQSLRLINIEGMLSRRNENQGESSAEDDGPKENYEIILGGKSYDVSSSEHQYKFFAYLWGCRDRTGDEINISEAVYGAGASEEKHLQALIDIKDRLNRKIWRSPYSISKIRGTGQYRILKASSADKPLYTAVG